MCRAIAGSLRPGGRFVTVNNNPREPPGHFATGRAYGFTKRLRGELKEGAPIVWEFFLPDGAFEITNYYLSVPAMEEALREAGLSAVRWHAAEVSPAGIAEFGTLGGDQLSQCAHPRPHARRCARRTRART